MITFIPSCGNIMNLFLPPINADFSMIYPRYPRKKDSPLFHATQYYTKLRK